MTHGTFTANVAKCSKQLNDNFLIKNVLTGSTRLHLVRDAHSLAEDAVAWHSDPHNSRNAGTWQRSDFLQTCDQAEGAYNSL